MIDRIKGSGEIHCNHYRALGWPSAIVVRYWHVFAHGTFKSFGFLGLHHSVELHGSFLLGHPNWELVDEIIC